ncbi:AcrR family transcriptional regulator [Sphingobium xenophagum]|uniref:AcrR family transcriptional regulator n=2 Tax=Sphingobium xenophagum TaxID=121428 RepID=A0ABU1X6S2_SPHXE|nr:AcrR family transcriptional regulator [Sphingobium xenophagum]
MDVTTLEKDGPKAARRSTSDAKKCTGDASKVRRGGHRLVVQEGAEDPPAVGRKRTRKAAANFARDAASTGEHIASQSEPEGTPRRPRQQQRAVETRRAILGAALQEFAKKGFDAASIRDIADRLGIQHPLITYHYKTKDALWQAVAEQVVGEFREDFDAHTRSMVGMEPIDRVRELFRSMLNIEYKYPDLHRFMLNESRENGPRLRWIAANMLAPVVNTNLPDIRRAQATGDLPAGEPILLHFMLIGMTTVLFSAGAAIEAVTGLSVKSPGTKEAYFDLIEAVMFGRKFDANRSSRSANTSKRGSQPTDPSAA